MLWITHYWANVGLVQTVHQNGLGATIELTLSDVRNLVLILIRVQAI